jgi:hypothetical protein
MHRNIPLQSKHEGSFLPQADLTTINHCVVVHSLLLATLHSSIHLCTNTPGNHRASRASGAPEISAHHYCMHHASLLRASRITTSLLQSKYESSFLPQADLTSTINHCVVVHSLLLANLHSSNT